MTTDTFTWSRPKEIIRRRIPLGLIDVTPEYERVDSLVEDDALRRSIEKSGVQQPIIVIPVNGRFTLVKGTRRLAVSILAKFKDIPAIVDTPPQGVEIETYRNRLRFVLTHARQDLSPSQRCNLIKQMMSMFGLNQKDVADYLGYDAGSITNWMAIGRYIKPIVRAIDKGRITMFHARAFDGMTREGQINVWKRHRNEIPKLSGHLTHQMIRGDYSPTEHPKFYVNPKKTIEKLGRTRSSDGERIQQKRKAKARPKLTQDAKKAMVRDLETKEIELADSQAELKQFKRECVAAAPIVHAILRNDDITALLDEGTKEELEVFAESY